MFHRQKESNGTLPQGPDELVGVTEGGKALIGLLFSLAVLAVLVWAILTAMRVHLPVL